MRQDEILAILKASSEPMTVVQILEAHGIRRNRTDTDQANIRKHLYTMIRQGTVRQAGQVKGEDGHLRITWEAVE